MGLFSKKKEDITMIERSNLPKFPEFPKINNMPQPNLPSYEKQFVAEKEEALRPKELPRMDMPDLGLPMRNREERTPFEEKFSKLEPMPMPKMAEEREPRLQEVVGNPFTMPLRIDRPVYDNQQPQQQIGGERPLFIKVEEYREAMGNIENLKKTLKETEELLDKIESIRMAEEEELKRCQSNVDAIKEQLLFIDKRLFEV